MVITSMNRIEIKVAACSSGSVLLSAQ